MGYKPKSWPDKANGALEDTLSHLKTIERATAEAQKATIDGNKLIAMQVMSDIRTQAMLAYSILVMAKAGKYSD